MPESGRRLAEEVRWLRGHGLLEGYGYHRAAHIDDRIEIRSCPECVAIRDGLTLAEAMKQTRWKQTEKPVARAQREIRNAPERGCPN